MVAHSRTPLRVDRLRAVNAESERGTRNRVDRLRALNLPQRVVVDLDANGELRAVRRSGGQETKAAQAVENILDVWRIDDEWWRQRISRLYYDVMLEGGGHVVLFKDLVRG